MDLEDIKCSFVSCNSEAEVYCNCPKQSSYLCNEHINTHMIENVGDHPIEPALYLDINDKKKVLSQIHRINANIDLIQRLSTTSTNQIIQTAIETQKSLNKKLQSIREKMKKIIECVSVKNKLFQQSLRNLEEISAKNIITANFSTEKIERLIRNLETKDFTLPLVVADGSQSLPINFNSRTSIIIDKRVRSTQTPALKKLNIISKLGFNISRTLEIKQVFYSDQAMEIITGEQNGSIKCWSIGTDIYREIKTDFTSEVLSISDIPGTFNIVVLYIDAISLINLRHHVLERRTERLDGRIRVLKVTPSGSFLISGWCDGFLKIYRPNTLEETESYHIHTASLYGGVECLSINSDSRIVASGGNDGHICIITIGNLAIPAISIPEAHSGGVTCLAFTPDNQYLVSGGQDQHIKVWDTRNYAAPLWRAKKTRMCIRSIIFDNEISKVLTGDYNKLIFVWNIGDGNGCKQIKDKIDFYSKLSTFPDIFSFSKYLGPPNK